jgi:hypothetical protein
MVRGVHLRLCPFPQLRQGGQPVVVRFAYGQLRNRNELLASVQGIKVI